jgi:type IV secretory pathway VirJ component
MKFRSLCSFACYLMITQTALTQNITSIDRLPVNITTAAADTSKPLVLYITGDGGWNKFSKNLSTALAVNGYPVIALDAREYFWKKKTAAQTSFDVSILIRKYQKIWNRKRILLIGYSFGADVMPFVYNLLPADLTTAVININLLSPSLNTDFEVHIAVLLGAGFSGGESVVSAINKINNKPLTLIFGTDENNFPVSQLKNKSFATMRLDGGHHYDGDEVKLCETILAHLPKK